MRRPPHASFWRHATVIRRRSWGADAARGMVPADADGGQIVVCTVQERSQDSRPVRVEAHEGIEARRLFDVLIPALHPTTKQPQFPAATYPAGPAIRLDDVVEWGGRKLRVVIDVDAAGRGGFGHVYTAYCDEVV